MPRRTYLYRPGHPRANERGFVAADELGFEAPALAVNAPILAGRFYENTKATDGTDIGSRAKHREYMKQKNLTVSSDFSKTWDSAAKERAEMFTSGGGEKESRVRKEQIAKALHTLSEKRRR